MAFKVKFSTRAKNDLHKIVAYIHADAPLNAVRFRRKIQEKIQILATMATSFPRAPESQYARDDIHQLLYGQYRILYTVRHETVFLLTIRHGARQFLSREEVDDLGKSE